MIRCSFLAVLLLLPVASIMAQFLPVACNSRCPPLDETGQEVPSLCPGDPAKEILSAMGTFDVCHPVASPRLSLREVVAASVPPAGPSRLIVVANYYIGCNAGRREANVYSYASTVLHARYPNVLFLSSLKGGSAQLCEDWATSYEYNGAFFMGNFTAAVKQPLTINDADYALRDTLFTAPYAHPSYVIIDHHGIVRDKFVGPCCGRRDIFDCTNEMALELNVTLHEKVSELLAEVADDYGGKADCFLTEWTAWSECNCSQSNPDEGTRERSRTVIQHAIGDGLCPELVAEEACFCSDPIPCVVSDWSDWGVCSRRCGSGQRHRTREVTTQPAFGGTACPDNLLFTETGSCEPQPACEQQCVPELGEETTLLPEAVAGPAEGLKSPRDVAFHPKPGMHLGEFSSGRSFSTSGEEAWIANGAGNSITIVTGLGEEHHASITRSDRGWYHYLMNVTAFSFNSVGNSGRDPVRDTFAHFATCQDNSNTYDGLKEPNFFMGPSLYSSSPEYKNLVRHDGGPCTPADECFFLHSDMLHESPACPGIVHDPETVTAYGTVYWAIDGVSQQLVRYDFQQPHGPGKMDHSIAAVRRYPEVGLRKGPAGVHQGMVIDPSTRILYISSTSEGQVLRVHIDTGIYARTAREEFPIFSSRLPSFEYSIYECVQWDVFAEALQEPSGLALSAGRLFVAEHATGSIVVFDTASGFRMRTYETGHPGLMGLAFAPRSGELYAADAQQHSLLRLHPRSPCAAAPEPYMEPAYTPLMTKDGEVPGGLRDDGACTPNSTIPDSSLFDQVHIHNTGYASDNAAVQNDTMMDESAALLADREDCEPNSTLNFDALLLGGYFCHRCLPDGCAARGGGRCTNVQWSGYTCDNEVRITLNAMSGTYDVDPPRPAFEYGRTYRFVINAPGAAVQVQAGGRLVHGTEMEVGILTLELDRKPLPEALVDATGQQVFSFGSISGAPQPRCFRMSEQDYRRMKQRGFTPARCSG